MKDLVISDPLPGRRRAAVLMPSLIGLVVCLGATSARAEDKPVYRCPGNLYTDALSSKEAQAKGCKTLDGAPITVIQSVAPRVSSASGGGSNGGSSGASSPGSKVTSDDQKARDSDRRRILEAELRKEEEALLALQKEFNNGQPERKGDERNFQKYQDRVAEMKAALTRKEADVAALRRELGALGSSK
jgi:hypothetical protein